MVALRMHELVLISEEVSRREEFVFRAVECLEWNKKYDSDYHSLIVIKVMIVKKVK